MGFLSHKWRKHKIWRVAIAVAIAVFVGMIPLRIELAVRQAPVPQAILVLGGESRRMQSTAQMLHAHPQLEAWVSIARSNFAPTQKIFQQAGVSEQRLHYDLCPTDTVTNFTCLLQEPAFASRQIQHLYLVTSDYHMARATAIATIVLGSRGIVVSPVPVPSGNGKTESWLRIVRDCLRCIIWLLTGYTGANLKP